MFRRPPRSTRTDPLCPYPPLFRAVNIPSGVSFDTDKTQLKPALLPVLDSVGRSLNQHPELRAKVVGHTDSTGSLAHNQTLSVNRAKSRSEEPTSELQSLMRTSSAVFCLQNKEKQRSHRMNYS